MKPTNPTIADPQSAIRNPKSAVLWSDDHRLTEELGLWRQDTPGHTAEVAALESVHSGPDAASRLVSFAESGTLTSDGFHRVLEGLARLQHTVREDVTFGCFRWYAEESRPNDTNAAFFIGLNLLVLHAGYPERLSDASRDVLRGMFERLNVWFDHEVGTGTCYYPNKYLGDLVCSCLLKEALGLSYPSVLEEAMRDAGRYWRDAGWGWGEHLSDCYATILLNELGALLLLTKHLPDKVRALYRDLLLDLLGIDDFFDGGPRVPAIRSYAFRAPAASTRFRTLMDRENFEAHWLATSAQVPHLRRFCFGPLFERLGWQALAGVAEPVLPERSRQIPCFSGVQATSHITGNFRIGSLSRFPIMPGTDHATWGLSWQSMPVAFEAGGGADEENGSTWGFLRWEAREDGINRFHPARDKHHAYLHNALSEVTTPPPVGHTRAQQEGRRVAVLRSMPALSNAWEHLADGWDITGKAPEILAKATLPTGVSKIILRLAGDAALCLWHIPLAPFPGLKTETPQIEQDDATWSWRVRRTAVDLREHPHFANLWFVGLPDDPDPVLETLTGWIPAAGAPRRRIHWTAFSQPITLTGYS